MDTFWKKACAAVPLSVEAEQADASVGTKVS